MAAILEPQRFPRPAAPTRPDLRLIPGGRSTAPTPTRTGPASVAVAAALVAVVLLVVATLAVGRGALAGLAPAPATAEAPATASGRTVVVAPGDTLWSIARRLQPTGDVRPLVDRLAAANGGAAIAAGDRLVVPA
ncbi:MAG: LysM domain-containing protein [Acidimicrobiales bacterium]